MFSRSRNQLLTLLMSYHVRVTSKIQVNFRYRSTRRYWWLCLINFWHFFTIYVFEVKQPNFVIPAEPPCLGDLKNSGHLPVQEVLRGTDDCVLWIFAISSIYIYIYMYSRSGNHLLTFLLSYYAWGPRKSKTTSGSEGFWGHLQKVAHVQRVVRDIRSHPNIAA